jgi:uncharacterized membrane protein (DUF2068 family)
VSSDPAHATHPRAAGIRVIVGYKVVKAVLMVCAAVALWAGLRVGLAVWFARVALDLTEHSVHPILARLVHWLSVALAPNHAYAVEVLMVGDAALSAVEGWALHHGKPWGRWLVVLATGSLLPLEAYEIFRRPHLTRVLLFVVNLAIVVYLARRMHRHLE